MVDVSCIMSPNPYVANICENITIVLASGAAPFDPIQLFKREQVNLEPHHCNEYENMPLLIRPQICRVHAESGYQWGMVYRIEEQMV